MRDVERTKVKLVVALGRVLSKQGFSRVGINAVARVAGVDKVLIYRYFGGLPQLLRAYATSGDFWPTMDELLGAPLESFASPLAAGVAVLKAHLHGLRRRPITQELMRWELLERNQLTDELAKFREQQGKSLLRLLSSRRKREEPDWVALGALLHAGITYLVLRSKTADVYMGLELKSESDWLRLERAIEALGNLLVKSRS